MQLDLLAIKGANVAFLDESTARKVSARLTGWDMELRNFAPLASKAKPSPLKVSGRIGSGRAGSNAAPNRVPASPRLPSTVGRSVTSHSSR